MNTSENLIATGSPFNLFDPIDDKRAHNVKLYQLDAALALVTAYVITAGVFNPYFRKLHDKIERAGLMKGKIKHFINLASKGMTRLDVAVMKGERETYFPCTSALLSGFKDKYTNHSLASRIQYRWMKENNDIVKELYVLRKKIYSNKCNDHADILAIVDIFITMANITITNAKRIDANLRKNTGMYYKAVSLDTLSIIESIKANVVSIGNILLTKPLDSYLVNQVTEQVKKLNDSVVIELCTDQMQSVIDASVYDYYEFYIAHIVKLLQTDKFGKKEQTIMFNDLTKLKVDSMFPLRCLKDWKTLARELPEYDDTQDLQDVLTGVDDSVKVPKTPHLDRLRRRLVEIRTKGF